MHLRPLHFVYKISNRRRTIDFYRDVLLMKCLRHEEFEEGCKASCNGPYDGKWSKTMIGYGNEDDNFVAELTYNYGIREYKHGNDYNYLEINSKNVYDNVIQLGYLHKVNENGHLEVLDPNGYKFVLKPESSTPKVTSLSLFSSNLNLSCDYWNKIFGLDVLFRSERSVVLGISEEQPKLEFVHANSGTISHETAYGRIAFACQTDQLEKIEKRVNESNNKVLTPLVSLDTPGKATVHVVILADPDGHEICIVGDEGFRQLSRTDDAADKLLNDAMFADNSDEWLEKHRFSKQ